MAFAGISNINGLEFLNDINLSKIFSGVGNLILIISIMVIVCGIVIFVVYYRGQKKLYKEKLHFFEEVNGQMVPVKDLLGAELIIPNTNIKVFYIKSEDLYMPRGTKKMGKNSYWYAIRNNREIVNFTLKNINQEMAEAGLDYDHTDMRYANNNLREIIKRNYKDKSTKWWKEYKDLISTVIYAFVFTLCFYFLISQIGGLIDEIGVLMNKAGEIISISIANAGGCSGIAPA